MKDGQVPNNGGMVDKEGSPLPMWYRFFAGVSRLLTALTGSGTTAKRPTSYLFLGRPYFNTDTGQVEWWDGSAWVTYSGGGGGAPTTATYVTMTNNATLTNERTLAVGSPITLSDGGANNPVTLDFDETVTLGNNARVAVAKNSGATVGTRRKLNFIEGTNVTLTVADDPGNEEVDVTVAASGGTFFQTSVNFGSASGSLATPSMVQATVSDAGVGAGSRFALSVKPGAGRDFDELEMSPVSAFVGNIVNGVSFDLMAVSDDETAEGTYIIECVRS